MDANNWRPAQVGEPGEPTMDTGDWRVQLQQDSRQRIVNKIIENLKRHIPFSGQEGLQELQKIARRFEERIYAIATSQPDYLRKISMKMMTMETKSQNAMGNSLPSNLAGNSKNPLEPGSLGMQSQVNNQGQSLPIPMGTNQSQARQQILSQGSIASKGVQQGSSSLTSSLNSVGGLAQNSTIENASGQNSNLQNIQNISNVSHNSIGNSMAQQPSSNMFANSQRQMQGRQQEVAPQQQQQLQSHNTQQYLYHQKLQPQQLLKQKLQQGNIPNSLMQSYIQHQQQQQQQEQQQHNQLQSSQQAVMPNPLSGLQLNQQSSVQQSTQPVLCRQQPQQASLIHQQPAPMQQEQQINGQQPNLTSMQQNQLVGQQNGFPDMQQQQQQRLLGQQNNLSNLDQQNHLSNIHQQKLGPQSNASVPQLVGTQSGNTSMVQQSKIPMQQQTQQSSAASILSNQGQQSQIQPSQQQPMLQIQSQPGQLQQQLGLQQQSDVMQRDMRQRLQTSSPLLQPQNMMDQQKQVLQPQRPIPEASSTSLDSMAQTGNANGEDWQEEVYQKINAMKETYLPELYEMYQKVADKLRQHESFPQQPKNEQLEKFKIFKTMLERMITFLKLPKTSVTLGHKEKLGSFEKQIINFISSHRPRKMPALQHGHQLHPPHMNSMQQSQSQITQVQPHETLMNPQMQSMNLQQNNMMGLQQSSLSSLSGVANAPQNMMNSLQAGSKMDLGQGKSPSSLQQVAVGSLQQNPVSAPQQVTVNTLSSQSGMNSVQQNLNPLQSNNLLQYPHLKQQQEQQQFQHSQMPQQLMQKQQLLQQQQRVPQRHQMTDVNDLKMRQQMSVKPEVFQRHHTAGGRSAYHHQQLKPGASFPVPSPQLLQAKSPQLPQHPSQRTDQQHMLTSLTKVGTPLQSANSPFIVPSPSTPLATSPMPGESEKISTSVSLLPNAGNIGHQQTTGAVPTAQALAIGTPGISASPLLVEFTSMDGNHGNASTIVSGKSSVTEQPLERLIEVVKSMSPEMLSASVSDIDSVVSMVDRIAGSDLGNGSRAAVGEDLVAMTNCRLQARNYITQEGTAGTRKMRRYTSATPLSVESSASSVTNSFKQLTAWEASDLASTATSVKRLRIEANQSFLEEIREINQRLIDTVIDINDEDVDPTAAAAGASECGEGTIVKCSFNAVALCPNLKSQYASAQMSPIQPLRLLVPKNYPNCSPILLDMFPSEISKEFEDLSVKTKSRFSISLRSLSQPMTLGEIARTWDVCARAVVSEYAQQHGGGSFGSTYGTWENSLSAA